MELSLGMVTGYDDLNLHPMSQLLVSGGHRIDLHQRRGTI